MLCYKRFHSSIFLFVTIFSFASHSPVEAFLPLEQFSKVKAYFEQRPMIASVLTGALIGVALGWLKIKYEESGEIANKEAFLAQVNQEWPAQENAPQEKSQEAANQQTTFPEQTDKEQTDKEHKITFADVAGAHEAKEELQDIVNFLKEPEKYTRLGAQMNRGILLEGNPGNGKTLLAKAIAGEAGVPFIAASGSEFVEMYVGLGASRVRELFARARESAPCIIFIDEFDAIGRTRTGESHGGREFENTLNQLLVEMDGFSSKESTVIIIGATNRTDILDRALLRPGRFDKTIHVPNPDAKSREQILHIHAKKVTMGDDVDLAIIAQGTPGWSGADLAGLINEAAMIATKKEDQAAVTMADLDAARDRIIIGQKSRSVFPSPEELKLTAYHEAGHALVGMLMPYGHVDPLYKVTIAPHGAALGVTFSIPDREKYTQSKEMCLALIAKCMGGRAAEALACNMVGTGAGNDFAHATAIARNMVCNWGMSEKLGPVIYNVQANPLAYSEHTRALIDQEIQSILEQSLQRATDLLTQHRDKLDVLAHALLERETMSAQEVYELLGMQPHAQAMAIS